MILIIYNYHFSHTTESSGDSENPVDEEDNDHSTMEENTRYMLCMICSIIEYVMFLNLNKGLFTYILSKHFYRLTQSRSI